MITLREVRFEEATIPLRRPFGFGMARLESLTHLKTVARFEIDGEVADGCAGENVVPRWFVKDASLPLEEDIARLRGAIHSAGGRAINHAAATPFAFWWSLYQSEVAANPSQPGLVTQLAVSLVERAMIDAWCRRRGRTFAAAVRDNSLGVVAAQVHSSLGAMLPAEAIPEAPVSRLSVRHTVGLTDDLAILPAELDRTGINRLKVKLGGDPSADVGRIVDVMKAVGGAIERITLDGNENYATVAALEDLLDRLTATPTAESAVEKLAWVEQPLHRSVSLSPELKTLFQKRPELVMVLDESDAAPADLPAALSLGYAGTTHKNCKGVFKSILAAMLLRQFSLQNGRKAVLSGEDLTIVAPWSQAQDLAVAAAVGVADVERNGHSFADGLSALSREVQEAALNTFPKLYHRTESGVELAITGGCVDLADCNERGFGGARQ